jgi:hypothetical protein
MKRKYKALLFACILVWVLGLAVIVSGWIITDPGDMCGDIDVSAVAKFIPCTLEGR